MRKKTISKIVHLDPDQLPLGGSLARGGWGSSTPCPVPATIANLGGRYIKLSPILIVYFFQSSIYSFYWKINR